MKREVPSHAASSWDDKFSIVINSPPTKRRRRSSDEIFHTIDDRPRRKPRSHLTSRDPSHGSADSGTSTSTHHGLSDFYSTAGDEWRLNWAQEKKAKNVDRSTVLLHRGYEGSTNQGSTQNSRLIHPGEQLNGIFASKLRNLTGPKVTFINNDDDREPDGNFEFTNRYILREGVHRVDDNFTFGCPCGEECQGISCQCFIHEADDEEEDAIVPYQTGNEGVIVLREDFIQRDEPSAIYECNSKCSCGPNCSNRVVQRGRTVELEIFGTKNRGFGEALCESSLNLMPSLIPLRLQDSAALSPSSEANLLSSTSVRYSPPNKPPHETMTTAKDLHTSSHSTSSQKIATSTPSTENSAAVRCAG